MPNKAEYEKYVRGKLLNITSLLVMLSILTMGISPACDFISGSDNAPEGYIEICSDDGEIRLISLAEAGLSPDTKPAHQHHASKSIDCAFCFTAAHNHADFTKGISIEFLEATTYISNGGGLIIPKTLNVNDRSARGPPSSFV